MTGCPPLALWFIIVGTATITGAFGLGTGSTVQGHEIYAQAVNCLLNLAS